MRADHGNRTASKGTKASIFRFFDLLRPFGSKIGRTQIVGFKSKNGKIVPAPDREKNIDPRPMGR